jgi:MFS family permease
MVNSSESLASSEWRHWPVLIPSLAGVVLCALHGYSLGVMIGPLEQEFHWSRAEISSGPFIISFVALLVAPLAGLGIDRFGPRRIGLFGVFFFCGALALLSTTTSSIVSWWWHWALLGLANMFVLPTVWTAAISGLFSKNRGKALAIALCGTGICAAVVPPLTNHLIEVQGWRQAYISLGAIFAAVIAPLVFFFFRGAVDIHREASTSARSAAPKLLLPGFTTREGLKSRTFLKLACAVVVFSAVGVALTANAVPILQAQGFGRSAAAGIAGLVGVGSVIGRLGGGVLLDHFDAKKVAAFSVLAPVIAITTFLFTDNAVLPASIACVILGLAVGTEVDACAYLVARHFGMRSFGAMFGTINGLLLFTNGIAPLLANHVYDVTRSYHVVLWILIPMSVIACVLFLLLGEYPSDAETLQQVPVQEQATAQPTVV